jgi:PST family polysaccharide transporter
MVVLARIFTPEQFGIFAVIQVFALFFALFSEIGLVPALVNENHISKRMRNAVFGFTLAIGLVVCLLFLLFSPAIAWFYDYSAYEYLVIPMAVSIIFNACSIVPTAAYIREKKFLHIARAEIIAELASLGVVLLLLSMQRFDAVLLLAFKPFTVAIVKFLGLWHGSRKTELGLAKLSLEFSLVRPLFRFSVYQFMSNVMVYFSRNLDNLLVGKYLGATSLGIYDKAYQLMRYPLMLLTFAMAPAIQPVLKELNHDKVKFAALHNKFITYLALVAGVIGFALYFAADFVVWLLLGNQWGDVAGLLKILAVSVPIQIVLSSSGGFFQAANRPDLMFVATVFSFITNVSAIVLAITFGDLYVLCWAITLSFSINFFQCYYLLGKHVFENVYSGLFAPLIMVVTSSLIILALNLVLQ